MNLNALIDLSYQTFQNQTQLARLVLLHPRSRYRSVLIAKLLSSADRPVLYYAIGPDDLDLKSLISGLTHDLANQHPTFGRHINILPPKEANDFDKLVEAFSKDLAEVSQSPFYLVLDEYDRSDTADDIQMFVEKLVANPRHNCTIILNGRTLPRLPWVSLIAQKRAVLLEDDLLIKDNFYRLETSGKHQLEIFGFGPGQVLLDGHSIDTWEGHLPRLLFFFALDRPIITRSEICQAFWPELHMDQAVNVFHVTKRRLHKALDMDVLVHDGGYYRVNPDMVIRYDIMEFATALMNGRTSTNDNRLAFWQRAIDLYRGPFLQGHVDKWILNRRTDFKAGYLEALCEIAFIRLEQERPEHALGLFQRVLAEDGTRENIHREVMKLYAKLGRRSEAAAHYQRLTDDLKKDGQSPTHETLQVYKEIMN